MAFVELGISKSDVPRRSAEAGRGSLAFPATGLTEHSFRLAGCSGCVKASLHDACLAIGVQPSVGFSRYGYVPEANKPTVADLNKIQSALAIAYYSFQGYVGPEVRWNAGGANNGSQSETYEIVSASGTTLTLRGRNPKRMQVGSSRLNPVWPFPDPVTGSTARLIGDAVFHSLPVGAAVEFAFPSVLNEKVSPFIVSINPPESDSLEDVEFSVECSVNVSNADEPFDEFYPPEDGKYYCTVRWEGLAPNDWKNFQAPAEEQWTARTVTFTTAEEHELLDTGGNSTRILWPGMIGRAVRVALTLADTSVNELSESQIRAILSVTDDGTASWESTIDLSGFTFASAAVSFWCESRSGDTKRLPFFGTCVHAQADPSDSYNTTGGHRCTAEESTGFANFTGAVCWKPSACNRFAIGDAAESWGTLEFAPADFGDEQWLSNLWTAGAWVVVQGIPGISAVRNFSISKPAGALLGIQGLCGGFVDVVPEGIFPAKAPLFPPSMGQRETWTDGDGNHYQQIRTGAFYAAPLDLTATGGDLLHWTVGTTPDAGLIAANVSGWGTKTDALGETMDAALARLPHRLIGRTHVYNYTQGGSGLAVTNRLTTVEAIVAGFAIASAEDAGVASVIRARFG